jgi:16S rRNA C967 or C1407 C5-methylase (RsmB/RsmF family)
MLTSEIVTRFACQILPSEDIEAFVDSILSGSNARSAVIWLSAKRQLWIESELVRPPYLPEWISLPALGEKPGALPEHEAGMYYCADLSSAILGGAVARLITSANKVVDVCAAPGGKSILMSRHLSPSLLVCNEVVPKRAKILIGNLTRCSIHSVEVYSCDADSLAGAVGVTADVVIADVPCSAQSLGNKADYPFSNSTIKGNAARQKRIIKSAASMVLPGGYLTYITCTYSQKENEDVINWFRKREPQFVPITIPGYEALQSQLADFSCYRIWPFDGLGKGGFVCVLKNQGAACEREGKVVREVAPIWGSEEIRKSTIRTS